MARPFGKGLYGRHRYSSGAYARAAAFSATGAEGRALPQREQRVAAFSGATVVAKAEAGGMVYAAARSAASTEMGVGTGLEMAPYLPKVSSTATGAGGRMSTSSSRLFNPLVVSSSEARMEAFLRRTWEQEGPGVPPWGAQDVEMGDWAPQGERPPRKYGIGRYSAGRYATLPPVTEDKWVEVENGW